MHASHQAKLLQAGFTIYSGTTVANKLVIKAKTPENHNWHNIETGFNSKAELKRRLQEIDNRPMWIDLNDSKNGISIF